MVCALQSSVKGMRQLWDHVGRGVGRFWYPCSRQSAMRGVLDALSPLSVHVDHPTIQDDPTRRPLCRLRRASVLKMTADVRRSVTRTTWENAGDEGASPCYFPLACATTAREILTSVVDPRLRRHPSARYLTHRSTMLGTRLHIGSTPFMPDLPTGTVTFLYGFLTSWLFQAFADQERLCVANVRLARF